MGVSGPVGISSGELSATIAPLGAELLSLTDADGREFMTDADPAWWTGHAPLLFPIVGGLGGDRYRLDGQDYSLPRHGFARRSLFECVTQEPGRALFRLADSAETRAAYPFAFVLEMEFSLDGWTLGMNATVHNPGRAMLPFSFGYHPAFAWPLPGGGAKLAHYIEFERDEPAEIRRLDEAGLVAFEESSPMQGRFLRLDPAQYEADAMIWDRLESRKLTYCGEQGGPALEISFPEMPYLGIWQKPGARFICIEPWAGLADDDGFGGDFREKRGVMELAPGESRSFRVDVTVHPG